MNTKKWISELQCGELFTILPNVTDASHYYIALGDVDTISKKGSRPCLVLNDFNTQYFFANVQVYTCGLIIQKLNIRLLNGGRFGLIPKREMQ